MSEYTTKKPTGLQVERNGNDFTFSWKIKDADHGKGQKFQYKTSETGKWKSKTVTAKQTSITVTLSPEDITALSFQVQGCRKTFNEKVTVTENGKEKTKSVPVTTLWSAWAVKEKAWAPEKPTKPTLSYERTGANVGAFTVEHTADTDGEKIAKYVEYATCASTSLANPPKDWPNASTINGLTNVSQTFSYTEETETISSTGLVRWFRTRCVGPGGASAWVYASHAYSIPSAPLITWISASHDPSRSITTMAARWETQSTLLRPVDEETMQYVFGTPTDYACNAPGAGWNDAMMVTPSGKRDIVTATVSDMISNEQCMWMRIKARHDENVIYSSAVRVMATKLNAPAINANPNFSTGSVSVSLTINTSCSVARHVIFYRNPSNPKTNIHVAVLEPGVSSTTVTIPAVKGASKSCIGAFAFVGPNNGVYVEPMMMSDSVVDEDIAPVAPDPLTVTKYTNDSVFVKLSWKWADAKDLEIGWADNRYAWESNDQPKTYTVTEIGATTWLIQGLEVGKTWYFRGRYHGMIDDDEATSAWSNMTSIDLATNPQKPVLTLNRGFVLPGGSVSASWDYANEDNSPQVSAQICLATISGATVSYGTVIAHGDSALSMLIRHAWSTNTQYYLALRVRAQSGRYSDWSDPVGLFCPAKPTLSWQNDGIVNGVMSSLDDYIGYGVIGRGTGRCALSITRARDYHVDRPDDGTYDGYVDESIWTKSEFFGGAAQLFQYQIDPEDLIGELDDGAHYNLIATITDSYEQTVTITLPFKVNWTHKASIAKPTAEADNRMMAMRITPTMPDGYVSGDTFDIYRITADQPELIVRNGEYGTTYVDPYPAFGTMCGHRVVAKTSTGSYITEDDTLAWYDLGESDGDVIINNTMVIDCNGMQITLPLNIELSNKWQKDFKRTSYLGGSVQGDWNPAVLRDLTAKTVIVKNQDTGELMDMRDLAAYAGPAHIRTPDGSSFACDIQVTEDASYNDKKVRYSLSVKGIEPQEPDGLTLEEWLALHPVGPVVETETVVEGE